MTTSGRDTNPGSGRAVLTYNLLRLGLLAACIGLGLLVGLRGLWLFVVALLVSGIASYFLLAKQRIAMGTAVENRVARTRTRMAERAAAEDAYVDAIADLPRDGDQPSEDTNPRSVSESR